MRPWQHVLDCLTGYLSLIDHFFDLSDDSVATPSFHDFLSHYSFNFGPSQNSCRSVKELWIFLSSWGDTPTFSTPDLSFPEKLNLSLCSDKATSLLGWSPRLDFEESIKYTINWYHKFANQECICL